ncbi:Glu-tRNA(Gln) amidotransferase subunit GatD [Candidatus Woesearchaeota archaeon]|nr:Glu-tRNA(Gln) amidotransferase subunit GatD [Candidatus Woesearchaeota archaeon]
MSGAKKAGPKDHVRVITGSEEYIGILMPRPEILEEGITVLKLENGYNIGIEDKKIKSIELIKPYAPKQQKKKRLAVNPKLPTVSILSTGGTISSKIDYSTGGVCADYTAEDFVEMCPELEKTANIRAKKVMNVMSEDFTYKDWQEMARSAVLELKKKEIDGVVITMGTDMLHFAASALSFFIRNPGKPVIITAAQRSIDRGSSDAFMNLVCSVNSAANLDFSGVASCMHGTADDEYCIINRGTKVRKMHTSRRDAFRPVNELPIAKVYPDSRIEILNKEHEKRSRCSPELDDRFCSSIALVQIYPGMKGDIIDFYVDKGYKGIVLSATALGHVPTGKQNSILENISNAISRGVTVVIASQTLYGRTHPYVYTNLRKLSIQLGCVFAGDMLPETAFVKLGWVLGHKKAPAEIRELFLKNIAGELTERSSAESFLF